MLPLSMDDIATKEHEMFKLFKHRYQRDANSQEDMQTTQEEKNLRFRSHSFSTSAALAMILCQPCRMDSVEGKLVCKL
jgi:hypothetical protein